MNSHRYQYLYLPLAKFLDRLSPRAQLFLVAAQLGLVIGLLCFKLLIVANYI
jgi:hypothetical protein